MKEKKYDWLYNIADTLRMIAISVLIVLLLYTFVIRHKSVSGDSMYPTLRNDEQVLINVAASYCSEPQRFDVVVVHSPFDDDLWVKRIIGLPKETVEYRDDQLYINDQLIEEPFLDKDYQTQVMRQQNLDVFTKDYPKHTLKEDEYLLVGDNRNSSLDSRIDRVGFFHRDQIIAKGMLVYYPFDKVRYVSNGT